VKNAKKEKLFFPFPKSLFLDCKNLGNVLKSILSVFTHARKAMEISKHLVDLVSNSIEALAKHVLVILSEEEEGAISVEVSDDGVGFSQEEVDAALRGEKAPRGRGLALLRDNAQASGGSFEIEPGKKGTVVRALFKGVPLGAVGDALIVFWQEMPITVITLSAVSARGGYVFDSRLIEEKFGDRSDIGTMVKVRKDVNYALTNFFGGK